MGGRYLTERTAWLVPGLRPGNNDAAPHLLPSQPDPSSNRPVCLLPLLRGATLTVSTLTGTNAQAYGPCNQWSEGHGPSVVPDVARMFTANKARMLCCGRANS